MTDASALQQLLADYAGSTGLGKLQPDDAGVVALLFDDRLVLHLAPGADAGSAVLYAKLAPSLPEGGNAALMRRMLEAGFPGVTPGGATLALDGRDGAPMLVQHVRLHGLSAVAFQDLVADLVAAGLDWMDVLAGNGAALGGNAADAAPVAEARFDPGFMRV